MKQFLKVSVIIFSLVVLAVPAWAQFPFFENPLTGKPAPDFTLSTLNEKAVNMTQYRSGQKAIIFFWATWCPHCRIALKELNQDSARIQDQGIKIIIIDLGEDKEQVEAHIRKNKYTLDIFLDIESSLAEPYGIIGVPTFFFVDEKGIIKMVKHSLPKNLEEVFGLTAAKLPKE